MGHEMGNLSPLVSFLLGVAMAIACVFFYMSVDPWKRNVEISSWSMSRNSDSNVGEANETMLAPNSEVDDHHAQIAPKEMSQTKDLASLLKSVAMDDNTVILTEINEAWAAPNSVLDLFLESFRVGEHIEHLLDHLLIVAVDQKAFDRCNSVHSHCYFHKMQGNYSSEKVYMTKDYLEMMWSRNKFQQRVLELGYNFLFTDVDIIWFRDPLRRVAITSHMATSSDFFFGDEDSLRNLPNGGFLYAKSCAKTVEFYKNWQLARERFPGKHEQYIFNKVKGEFAARFRVKIQFLDTAYCGGFCQLSRDLNKVCTLHANCCIGLQNKLHDLRNVVEDWKKYKALTVEEKRKGDFHWRVPGRCIH